jgi:DNA-binding winged helix-turn-helix (wHTH) protein/TolB-like protein
MKGVVAKHVYQFGPFELDILAGRLLRDGDPVALTPKAFDLLRLLVENHGRLLEKGELMRRLWADTFVEEANLTQHVFTLRKILGEQPNGRPYIDTVPRRGYLFVADVEEIVEPSLPAQAMTSPALPGRRLPLAAPAAAATVLVAAIVAGVVYLEQQRPPPPAATARGGAKTLAVLPFRPLGTGSADEYLALGMADAVITRLAQIHGLVVRPTGSVLKYAQSTNDPLASGRELGVDSLVDGRFQRSGDRIRVTVQLLNVRDGSSMWGDTFDGPFRDVFAVQDAISERVAQALVANLTPDERERVTRRYTQNTEAYQLYLRGRYSWERRTADSLRKSVDYYEQAIANDPAYALAYAGLADSYNILGNFGVLAPSDAYPKAKAAAARALEIDKDLAQAEVARAFATYLYDRDWDAANRGFARALNEAPNYGPGHQWYAVCLVSRGRFDDAVAEIRRARGADPLSVVINAVTSWIYYLARRNGKAIVAAKETIQMDPNFPLAHTYLGMAYASDHRDEEAAVELRQGLGRSRREHSDRDLGLLGLVLARQGRTSEAREVLRTLERDAHEEYRSPYGEALVRLGLGEKDRPLALLNQAVDEHHPWAIHFNVDPALDGLRSEPRFTVLLQRIGIPVVALPIPR